jgi:hypothetical protein
MLDDTSNAPDVSRAENVLDDDKSSIDTEYLDMQALAEEVYALLKQELRLERERRGWHQTR